MYFRNSACLRILLAHPNFELTTFVEIKITNVVQINKLLNTHYHKLTVGVFVTLVAWVGCSNRPAGPYQQRQRSYLTTAFTPSLTITSRGSDTGKQTNKLKDNL